MTLPRDVEAWLAATARCLAGAPDRAEIMAELRDHFATLRARGARSLLREFPPPEVYAAAFPGARAAAPAPHRRLAALAAAPLALVQIVAIALVALGVIKLVAVPELGVWVAPHGRFVIGVLDAPDAHELLGWAAVPLFIAVGLLLRVAARRARAALLPHPGI
jgi:hypothetical protein